MRSPLLLLSICCHLVMATMYAWQTPAFEGPDENSHYEYAWHIANAGKLPITQVLAVERGLPQTEGCTLAHHPPLYYALLATALATTGTDDTVFAPRENPSRAKPDAPGKHQNFLHRESVPGFLIALRMISVALGAFSLLCIHSFARLACPDRPVVAGLAALMVACLPMWSFLHGVLNSDTLAILLSSATLLTCAKALHAERFEMRRAITLGALLGCAWLTKTTTLFLGGIAFATGLILMWRARRDETTKQVFVRLAIAAAVALAITGWQFVRNWSNYGDPLGMSAHDASFQVMPDEYRWPYLLGPFYPYELPFPLPVTFIPPVFTSLLGRFGWFACPPSNVAVWIGAILLTISLLGLLRAAFERNRPFVPGPLWLILCTCLLVFAGTAYFNTKVAQPQGRLLFPAVTCGAVLLAAGLARATTLLPMRRFAPALLPVLGLMAFFGTFAPSFDPAHAASSPDHRDFVGNIVATTNESITWTTSLGDAPLDQPPTLRWNDDGAPAGTRYTLYAFDDDGRVHLAVHEWTRGALQIRDNEFAVSKPLWQFIPAGVAMNFRLRRIPATNEEDADELPATPALPFTRK